MRAPKTDARGQNGLMKKRTEIMVETDRLVVIQRGREKSMTVRCAECGTESFMFTVSEAAVLLHVSAMTVFRRAEAGQFHWLETPDGHLLICRNSLL
jgi:hypothetical protein